MTAQSVLHRLEARGESLAVAESLTGGALASAIVDVPRASNVFRGAVVAYQLPMKTTLLGIPAALLDEYGAVSAPVAEAMARGVQKALDASWSVATTGVAGPDPDSDTGLEPGTVAIAVVGPGDLLSTSEWAFRGNRAEIRAQSVEKALSLLNSALERE